MATVDLRAATPDDYGFAFRVHCAAMRPSVEPTFGWDEDCQARYFQLHFDPRARQIIRFEGVDVGLLSVEERDDALFLGSIEILPRYQGRGIGTTLIRQLQRRAEESGLPLRLQVLKTNRARELYERLGFIVTGETETHHHMTWADRTQDRP